VPTGEVFTEAQRDEMRQTVESAEADSGWVFAVEIGDSSADSRAYAETLHAKLSDPARSIVIQVDPWRRSLEIVTGSEVQRLVDNRSAALVAVAMQSAFAAGDLVRGVTTGVRQLAQQANQPKTLHADTP
jgi:uncharacterized membrane protein YgcG